MKWLKVTTYSTMILENFEIPRYKMTKIDHFLYGENTEILWYEMAKLG